jgi:hypothetical protein
MSQHEPDYYFNEQGLLVFTASFLKKRGYCCGNGCLHCPYDYINVPEPARTALLKQSDHEKQKDG